MTYPNRRAPVNGTPGEPGAPGAAGLNGKSVLLEADSDSINWKQTGDATYQDLVPLSAITGPAGDDAPPTTLTIGTITTLSPGSQATAEVTGAPPNQVLNLGIPSGLDGDDGSNGSPGTSASISMGTVTTLAAGASATAEITGTAPSFTLNLGIPRGNAGTNGADGAAGPSNALSIGTTTTGAAGTSAIATITGASPSQMLNLTIPRGADGSNGPSNTISIGTVTTGVAGSSVVATITGSSPNQALNLTIPRGDSGLQGNTGSPGSTGAAGPANTLTVGTVTAGTPAVTITGTSPNQTVSFVFPPGYSPQPPTARTVALGTAYQHTDTTKPFKAIVNVRATQSITLAGTIADKIELRVGATSSAVTTGTGASVIAVWESGITGIALMIGAGVQDGAQLLADLPAGWYFGVFRTQGTNASVVNAFTQSMTA